MKGNAFAAAAAVVVVTCAALPAAATTYTSLSTWQSAVGSSSEQTTFGGVNQDVSSYTLPGSSITASPGTSPPGGLPTHPVLGLGRPGLPVK